jgi:hypothetical protein
MVVELEGESVQTQRLLQQQAQGSTGADTALRPVLLLLSSGETTAFRIALRRAGVAEYTVSSDGVSGIVIQ